MLHLGRHMRTRELQSAPGISVGDIAGSLRWRMLGAAGTYFNVCNVLCSPSIPD